LRIVALERAPRSSKSGPDRRSLSIGPGGWTLRYDNRDGDWMAYDYRAVDRRLLVSASLPWDVCAGPLTGVVCGVLLGLEKRTLLHGACLEIDGKSIAILGASGHGKSTLAAFLSQAGAGVVTEDLLAPARTEAGWIVEPGAPGLHLLADAFAMFGAPADPARPAAPVRDGKYALELPATAARAVPLAGIYILDLAGEESEPALTRLSGRRAVQQILQHLYGASWIRAPDAADLRFCADLAAEVPVHSVSRPWRLDRLACTAELVLDHAVSEQGTGDQSARK
jgi:hypothetical protein